MNDAALHTCPMHPGVQRPAPGAGPKRLGFHVRLGPGEQFLTRSGYEEPLILILRAVRDTSPAVEPQGGLTLTMPT